jgi:AraC-like DNA-binding protein
MTPMAAPAGGASTFRFSTNDLPRRDRTAAFRELYGRKVLRLEIEPLPDHPFHTNFAARMLPGLGIVCGRSSPFRAGRTRGLLADGNDGLILQIATSPGVASQFGRQVDIGPRDAVLLSSSDVGSFTFASDAKILALSLSRQALAPLLADPHSAIAHPLRHDTEALRLLVRYLDILQDAQTLATPELQRLAVTHVYDLLALAFGATRDAAEIAKCRGVGVVRLRAIKADIAENLRAGRLAIGEIAARHRVTPRYVQMLFESEGTTFSEFLLAQRLDCAHRMLGDPRLRHRSITAVAFDAGFGDLSYFNRTFRRRFGEAPSDVRAARRHD